MGVEIISTGGTYKLLKENGIAVKEVEEVTGFPEMLDGRVKTLHPMIHAGILARRDVKEHMDAIAAKGIKPIDMVVVNLYPFKQTVLKDGVTFDEIVENIDIGGPSMIRAAAKNYKSVAVVTEPAQYAEIVAELKEKGEVSEELHGKLMAEAFVKRDYKIVSGGTDNHLMLVDLRTKFPELTGKQAEKSLVAADITTNKNMVPFDSRSPFQTSGLRFGTPAITTRGLKEDKMDYIVELIDRVLENPDSEENIAAVRRDVNALMADYPLFAW